MRRTKTFVSFDGDNDIHYYRLMQAWSANERFDFKFYDAHDINTARDSSTEETIKRRLSERLNSAKVVVSLIGNQTRFLYRFVRWELEQALKQQIPIIGVNLNKCRTLDLDLCPPIIRDELVVHVDFQPRILQHAITNWPNSYFTLRDQGKREPYYYSARVYHELGLIP